MHAQCDDLILVKLTDDEGCQPLMLRFAEAVKKVLGPPSILNGTSTIDWYETPVSSGKITDYNRDFNTDH